jgi:hypothetical protein
MKQQSHLWVETAALTLAALILASNSSLAADKVSVDPTGTWKLVTINPQTKAKSAEHTLNLKLEGGKLTGTMEGRRDINGKVKIFEWAIKDTKLQGNDIAFNVTQAPVFGQGPDSTTTYEGKVAGKTMAGKSETEWSGNVMKRDFEARRVKE